MTHEAPSQRVRRTDPSEPEHQLDPPVAVEVTTERGTYEGIASRWRGRWVYVEWSEGVGMKHLDWVLGDDVRRLYHEG